MVANLPGLIFYRMLAEIRPMIRRGGPWRQKVRLIGSMLLVPASFVIMWQLWASVSGFIPPGGSASAFFIPGLVVSSILYYLGAVPEMIREIGFARDGELLHICPLPTERIVVYRLIFGGCRTSVFGIFFILYPLINALFSSSRLAQGTLRILLVFAVFAWMLISAFWTSTVLLALARRAGVSRHAVFVTVFVGINIVGGAMITRVFVPGRWTRFAQSAGDFEISEGVLAGLLVLCIVSGYCLYRSMPRLWPHAALPADPGGRGARSFGHEKNSFSGSQAWAFYQKDFKDLCRNPAYRSAVLCCSLLLLAGLAGQWKRPASPGHESWRRMMSSLTLLYLIPLFFSARAWTLELRMVNLYRLVFPDPGRVLDLKWRMHSLINCMVIGIMALPLFLLSRPGEHPYEPAYYAVCVVLFVPVLTMLAIGLGAIFPSTTDPPNPIGITKWGFLIYLLLAAVLYAFLLDRMYLGAGLYSAFLVPLTLILYRRARKTSSKAY